MNLVRGKPGDDALGRGDGIDCTAGGVGDVLSSPARMTGEKGLVRAALLDAQAGLRADKLGAEFLALQVTLRRIVGGREDPDTDKRHGNGEQRRVSQ